MHLVHEFEPSISVQFLNRVLFNIPWPSTTDCTTRTESPHWQQAESTTSIQRPSTTTQCQAPLHNVQAPRHNVQAPPHNKKAPSQTNTTTYNVIAYTCTHFTYEYEQHTLRLISSKRRTASHIIQNNSWVKNYDISWLFGVLTIMVD